MGKLVVVQSDPVSGTDKHNVTGKATNPNAPPPTVPYAGIGEFEYHGAVTGQLSDLVSIGGTPVALVSSRSSLNAGESTPPTGKHSGPQGNNVTPTTPSPIAGSLSISDTPLGTGVPNAGAGSALLTVNGIKVLVDGDKIDTCSGTADKADSTVAAQGQSFVTTD
jgi:hypothetical protein